MYAMIFATYDGEMGVFLPCHVNRVSRRQYQPQIRNYKSPPVIKYGLLQKLVHTI